MIRLYETKLANLYQAYHEHIKNGDVWIIVIKDYGSSYLRDYYYVEFNDNKIFYGYQTEVLKLYKRQLVVKDIPRLVMQYFVKAVFKD
jgi:hypothetical protein